VTDQVKVFAFANQKGGVGKTTSCVNLAASLAAQQQRVLLLDLDPQGNATMGSGVDKTEVSYSMNDLLLQQAPISEVIVRSTPAGYHLVPSNSDLTAAEVALTKTASSERRLQGMMAPILDEYDWILIDCPPALNMLTLNALTSAHAVIIAMQCEYYALEGLSDLLSMIGQIQQSVNPGLKMGGILRTMFDARNRLAVDVSAQLVQHFGSTVFQSVIPRNVRLAEAPSHGIPIQLYDRGSR
jgi:chromosome partitioning protein